MSLVVVARWRTVPEAADQVAALLPAFAATAHATPGCLSWEAVRSETDPRSFVFVEHYTGHAAFELRRAGAEYRRLLEEEFLPRLELRERDTYRSVA